MPRENSEGAFNLGPTKEWDRGGRLGGAAPAPGERGGARGSVHRSELAERNVLSLSRQNKKCNQGIESAPTLPLHSGFVSGGSLPSPRLMEFTHKEKKNRRGEKGPSSYCRGWEGDKRKAIGGIQLESLKRINAGSKFC